jgi:hypothetical protein
MHDPQPNLLSILRVLAERRVEFIIVGGVCAVLHGAPVSTFDLDIVHARDAANLQRVMDALRVLDARYRDAAGRALRPTVSLLASPGHHLLMTTGGPLDLLGEIGEGRGFPALVPYSIHFEISDTLRVRALSLDALIEIKESLGREKDLATLAVLRRTRDLAAAANDAGGSR